jgi:hypothetical protein
MHFGSESLDMFSGQHRVSMTIPGLRGNHLEVFDGLLVLTLFL